MKLVRKKIAKSVNKIQNESALFTYFTLLTFFESNHKNENIFPGI